MTDAGGVVFAGGSRGQSGGRTYEAVVAGGALAVRVVFASAVQERGYAPLVEASAMLVGLAGGPAAEAGRKVDSPPTTPPRLPDPPTVVPSVRQLYADAVRVAQGNVSVLIRGESGTGKELLARFVHDASRRSAAAFVPLNCAALPRDLLEAELFGVEKGTATGVDARPGKFGLADTGTLFLDEIADMAPETQAKILRVLQEGEVYRLGAHAPRPARVRVISATNRDLDAMLAEGTFRGDLYHRIADWDVTLPPLRERRADIANLAAHFLAVEARRRGVRIAGISRAALAALEGAAWPGNIRQLEHEMARAVLFLEDDELLERIHLRSSIVDAPAPASTGTLRAQLERAERAAIRRALDACDGDVTRASELLGVGRSTVYRRMRALGIESVS